MSPSTKHVIFSVGLLVVITLVRNLHLVLGNTSSVVWSSSIVDSHAPIDHNNNKGQRISSNNHHHLDTVVPNRLIHRAEFGLGHRLLRTATAWHLARHLGVGKIHFQWNKCGDDDNNNNNGDASQTKNGTTAIFPYLFGTDEWWLLDFNHTDQHGRNILVRNDVQGYLPTQTFLDHRIPLEESVYKNPTGPFLSKIASDLAFYRLLEERFRYKDYVDEFMSRHKFRDHQVIGLHLRAGNGEKEHFTKAGRRIVNETAFVTNLIDLMSTHLVIGPSLSNTTTASPPPLLFLATDTPYLIPIISNLTQVAGIPTIVFPQIRLAVNQGVTFSALVGAGDKCLRGWQAMVIDMLLLSQSDILIAARHSSFTQSIPLPRVMERKQSEKGPHFCEVSATATAMSCFQDLPAWLFRDNPEHEWHYDLSSSTVAVEDDAAIPVRHKSMIHLPEMEPPSEFNQLVAILRRDDEETKWISYGKRFNPRYRNQKSSDHPGWNFT